MICKLNYQWTTFTFQISLVLYGSSNWNKAMHNAFSAIECQSVAIRTAICVWRSLWKSCPNLADVEKEAEKKTEKATSTRQVSYSAMADGAISSRFSMLHSSRNSRIGDGCEPTEMYAIRARFFTSPTALPCTAAAKPTVWTLWLRSDLTALSAQICVQNL